MTKLEKITQEKKVNPSELIQKTGFSRSHVYKILAGKVSPTIKTARKITNVLGVTLDEAFPDSTDESKVN